MELRLFCKEYFDNSESIHVGFYGQHQKISMHSHEFWEFAYVYEGEGTHYTSDGNRQPIKTGDVIIASPGAVHCITSPPTDKGCMVRVINLLIKDEKIQAFLSQMSAIHQFDEYSLSKLFTSSSPFLIQMHADFENIYCLFMVIAHEYNHFDEGSTFIMESSILNLLLLLLRQYEQFIHKDKVTTTQNQLFHILTKFIQANFSSPLSLNFLAEYVHLSPEYLSRYFKKHTGKNLSVYITEVRISHAKYYLRNSQFPISDISSMCGYKSISNFQKAFKQQVGMSAGEYRKQSNT